MVQTTILPRLADGTIDIDRWLQHIAESRTPEQLDLIRHACSLSQLAGENVPTYTGENCLQQGLAMADILVNLGLDHEAIAAAIVYDSVQYADLQLEDVNEHLGPRVEKLVAGTERMDAIRNLQRQMEGQQTHYQIDNLRKMLLAMVDDVRIVLIKLAERTCILRAADSLRESKQKIIAKETMEIYAPLANRLGIGNLKWEIEDLSFRYLKPAQYKEVAKLLAQRRMEREEYVDNVQQTLRDLLSSHDLAHADIMGRAKHIYSIYRKMQRKNVSFHEIYDTIAVRILVPNLQDCYVALSAIHETWHRIDKEFDDYIANPKLNGYRSIHTAVIGPEERIVEVQIRTHAMHEESEMGVAAHWRYKEGAKQSTQESKIAWLRQVLDWQRELASKGEILVSLEEKAFEDRVYVFTPAGDIVDLPFGSTPLDFAYYVHSEIGHRCRGAKVHGKIVPLTYQLKTGDQIEVLTTRHPAPSRDWLNPHLDYLKTSRAKAKVHHWFKQQNYTKNLAAGKEIVEREFKKLHIKNVDFSQYAPKFNLKTADDLLAAIGGSNIKFTQLLNYIQQDHLPPVPVDDIPVTPTQTSKRPKKSSGDIKIHGIGNLLTRIARCCQPIPGDSIIGYITQGVGVSIHRQDCPNIVNIQEDKLPRLISVTWGETPSQLYPMVLVIRAYDRPNLIRDISTILATDTVNVRAFSSSINKKEHIATIDLTIEIDNLSKLSRIIDKIQQLSNIIEVWRKSG